MGIFFIKFERNYLIIMIKFILIIMIKIIYFICFYHNEKVKTHVFYFISIHKRYLLSNCLIDLCVK